MLDALVQEGVGVSQYGRYGLSLCYWWPLIWVGLVNVQSLALEVSEIEASLFRLEAARVRACLLKEFSLFIGSVVDLCI